MDKSSQRQYSLITRIQNIFIPYSLRGRLHMMESLFKLAEQFGSTNMHATLQQAYCLSWMAASVTSAVLNFVYYEIQLVCLREKASSLKLLLSFEPLKSLAIGILEPFQKSRCGFRYISVLVHWFTKLVQVEGPTTVKRWKVGIIEILPDCMPATRDYWCVYLYIHLKNKRAGRTKQMYPTSHAALVWKW